MSDTAGLPGVKQGHSGTVTAVLISVGLAIVGLVLLGLPGAIVLDAAMVLAGLVSSAQLGGDQVWPGALMVSELGPFVLIPAHLILRRAHLVPWLHALLDVVLASAVILVASIAGIILSGQ